MDTHCPPPTSSAPPDRPKARAAIGDTVTVVALRAIDESAGESTTLAYVTRSHVRVRRADGSVLRCLVENGVSENGFGDLRIAAPDLARIRENRAALLAASGGAVAR